MTWLIVSGLVLINASVFLSSDDPQAAQKLLHHLNPYHFPDWYSTNLWLVFAGLLTALLLQNNRIQKLLYSLVALFILLLVFLAICKNRVHEKQAQPNSRSLFTP